MANRTSPALRQYGAALRTLLLLTVILGLAYPLAMTGLAQVAFGGNANGSLVARAGRTVGSDLIGQAFTRPVLKNGQPKKDADGNPVVEADPKYFQSRPSAAGAGYDPLSTCASNLGPENKDLIAAIRTRRATAAKLDGVDPQQVAPDALLASGSGLDPHISPAYAQEQVARVARARGLDVATVRALVTEHTQGTHARIPRRATRQRPRAQPGTGCRQPLRRLHPWLAAHQQTGQNRTMARGRLRIYLGAAPGVGKTVAMLGEAHRRVERGTDVVVGICETHGRAYTAALIEGLETVPLQEIEHRGASFRELDLDAVLARAPQVALIDELAHTNVPGSRNTKRWEDIHELLDAGIDVISTVNIQHLESLNDVVESITGVKQRETVPDDVVRAADQIELVDMTPEALRRRMAHGNVYAADKVDAALSNYFRPGNLSALRRAGTAVAGRPGGRGPGTLSPGPGNLGALADP